MSTCRQSVLIVTLMLFAQIGIGKELLFPTDSVVGTLEIRPEKVRSTLAELREPWIFLGEATGRVDIPDNHEVRLWVSANAAKNMSFLGKLPPDSLHGLNLWRTRATDSQVQHVATLTGLKYLRLEDSRITAAGISQLGSLTNLVEFSYDAHISNDAKNWTYGVDDESSKVFMSMPQLRFLYLRRNPVSSFALLNIARLQSLEYLALSDTKVTYKGLELLRNLKSLRRLEFGVYDDGSPISDEGAAKIAQVRQLTELGIEGTRITKEGLAHIATLPNLEKLSLGGIDVSPSDLEVLKSCKSLRTLSSSWNHPDWKSYAPALAKIRSLEVLERQAVPVNHDGLRALLTLPSLRELSVRGIIDEGENFTGIGEELAACTSMERLQIDQIPIVDEELKHLANLAKLESLSLSRTWVRGSGLKILAQLPQLRTLSLYADRRGPQIETTNIPPLPMLLHLSLPQLPDDADWYFGFKSLKQVSFSGVVSDAQIQLLAKSWPDIESLSIQHGDVGNAGVSALKALKKLNYLYVKGDFNSLAVVELKALSNLQSIWLNSDNVGKEDIPRMEEALQSTSINLQR